MKCKMAAQLHMDMDSQVFCQMYANVEKELNERIEKKTFYRIQNDRLIGAVTLGSNVDAYITDCFDNGSYLMGLLADAMSNQILFDLTESVTQEAERHCQDNHLFLAKQINIGEDIPLSFQKELALETDIITVSDTHMLSPLKSMTFLYVLSDQENEKMARIDPCETCSFNTICFPCTR